MFCATSDLVWFGCVLWHINPSVLLNAKSIRYMFLSEEFVGNIIFNRAKAYLLVHSNMLSSITNINNSKLFQVLISTNNDSI